MLFPTRKMLSVGAIFEELPFEIIELVYEYQGGIRIKNGNLKLSLDTYDNASRLTFPIKVNSGIWFSYHTAFVYKPMYSTRFLVFQHSSVKDIVLPEIAEEKRMHAVKLIFIEDDDKTRVCNIYESKTTFSPPIIGDNYVIIPLKRCSWKEHAADERARKYYNCSSLEILLPNQRVSSSAKHLSITGLDKGGWDKVFPRLKKYQDVESIFIKKEGTGVRIALVRTYTYLKPDELGGGTGWQEIEQFLIPITSSIKYIASYQEFMRTNDKVSYLGE